MLFVVLVCVCTTHPIKHTDDPKKQIVVPPHNNVYPNSRLDRLIHPGKILNHDKAIRQGMKVSMPVSKRNLDDYPLVDVIQSVEIVKTQPDKDKPPSGSGYTQFFKTLTDKFWKIKSDDNPIVISQDDNTNVGDDGEIAWYSDDDVSQPINMNAIPKIECDLKDIQLTLGKNHKEIVDKYYKLANKLEIIEYILIDIIQTKIYYTGIFCAFMFIVNIVCIYYISRQSTPPIVQNK
jgi:hypothetical protein